MKCHHLRTPARRALIPAAARNKGGNDESISRLGEDQERFPPPLDCHTSARLDGMGIIPPDPFLDLDPKS